MPDFVFFGFPTAFAEKKMTKVEQMWADINQMPRKCQAKVYHMPNGKNSESGQTGHMPML